MDVWAGPVLAVQADGSRYVRRVRRRQEGEEAAQTAAEDGDPVALRGRVLGQPFGGFEEVGELERIASNSS